MNLGQMQAELSLIIKDASLQPFLTDWINNAILEVAADFELPPLKLVDPVDLEVDTSAWLWLLPDDFHKKVFRVQWQDSDGVLHRVHIVEHIDHLSGRDHTLTADAVAEVVETVQGNRHYLGIHPLADNTLKVWYYRLPTTLSDPGDTCDCIPPGFERRVIYPKLIIQNYQFIVDLVLDFPVTNGPLQYWQAELAKGLYGASGQIGLLNFFGKTQNRPRRHGGRDPIGPSRRNFRGYF
jgi:hypothetical protein